MQSGLRSDLLDDIKTDCDTSRQNSSKFKSVSEMISEFIELSCVFTPRKSKSSIEGLSECNLDSVEKSHGVTVSLSVTVKPWAL